MKRPWSSHGGDVIVRYLAVSAPLHVVWEFSHMPLYGVWRTGTMREIVYNGLHCSIGDLMIAVFALFVGILTGGRGRWPESRWPIVASITIAAGIAYTTFSEWLNTSVRKSWSYSELMPLLPGTEIGLSPLAQWVVVPSVALLLARRRFLELRRGHVPHAASKEGSGS
jgi:hypothetical protein